MDQQVLRDFEALCVQEEAPACQSSCPLHVEAKTFIQLMAEGKITKARQQLDRVLPLSCITAYLCEGPCQNACKRASIDDGINMPLLERACILNSEPTKVMPLPESGKKICVAGAGLSSLVLAWELGKKGHLVHLCHTQEIGNDIINNSTNLSPNQLSNQSLHTNQLRTGDSESTLKSAMETAISQLKIVRVEFSKCNKFDDNWIHNALTDFDAVYLGLDDSTVTASSFNLDKKNGSYTDKPLTLVTENPKILAGGWVEKDFSFIQSMADGKKAAGSIDRILQGVAPEVAREKEATYETKLYTNLDNISPSPYIAPEKPLFPEVDEAQKEALRCIQCTCLECVKQCSFLARYKAYPKKYLREVYNNLSVVHGLRQANTMINSCTQCGLCAKICPQKLDMGEFFALARREMVETKRMPPSAHEFALEDMFSSNSDAVQFYKHQVNHNISAYMFFPGCQLPAVLPDQVISAYEHIQKHLTGGVGFHFACCGIPAAWARKDEYMQATINTFKNNWEEAGKPRYIFACASCSEFFHTHCPEIPQISLWEILADMPLPEKFKNPFQHVLSIHDPCSSRDAPAMQTGLRKFLSNLKQNYAELEFGKEMTRCCGFGGLASEAHPQNTECFVQERQADTDDALLVYCAICRERMQKMHKNCLHVLEIAFPTSQDISLEKSIETSFLSLFERQDRRLTFRSTILKQIWGESFNNMQKKHTLQQADSMQLHISAEVENILNERRILRSDLVAVLAEAEKKGASFYNSQTGHHLASFRPRQVSYWVEYKKENDGSYHIFDAYCHRMIVPGVDGEGALPNFEMPCCQQGKQEGKA